MTGTDDRDHIDEYRGEVPPTESELKGVEITHVEWSECAVFTLEQANAVMATMPRPKRDWLVWHEPATDPCEVEAE